MTAMTPSLLPAEHDERLRTALARLCLELVAEPGDDLRRIVRRFIYPPQYRWPDTSLGLAPDEEMGLLLVLYAAALRAPSEAWLRVEAVSAAAGEVQKWAETDGCREECDDAPLNRTGLACKGCAEWPHGELDEAVTALVHFVQREVNPTALDGITS